MAEINDNGKIWWLEVNPHKGKYIPGAEIYSYEYNAPPTGEFTNIIINCPSDTESFRVFSIGGEKMRQRLEEIKNQNAILKAHIKNLKAEMSAQRGS